MLSPYHEFVLLSKEIPYSNYSNYMNSNKHIRISDDIIGYIWDSLCWIPTLNPETMKPDDYGFQRWGPTIVEQKGAKIADNVFRSWGSLFLQGTDPLNIRGEYSFENNPDGEYERIVIGKSELVNFFTIMSDYAKLTLTGDYYILHFGI